MDNRPPAPPATRRDRLQRDALHGMTYARLRAQHQLVSERKELVMKGRTERCATCGTTWPCEVGQALAIIDLVLVWP